jgi:hypothetical protein
MAHTAMSTSRLERESHTWGVEEYCNLLLMHRANMTEALTFHRLAILGASVHL